MESARATTQPTNGDAGRAMAQELVQRLAPLGTDTVLTYATHFQRAKDELDRWDIWAAAYLIAGGCGDDSFVDFKAGLVTLGYDWHQRVVANPDSLADHPAVVQAATGGDRHVLFAESVNYVPSYAFKQITGDAHAYYEAVSANASQPDRATTSKDMGESFDFDDPEQMQRRLPRLAAMFLRPAAA